MPYLINWLFRISWIKVLVSFCNILLTQYIINIYKNIKYFVVQFFNVCTLKYLHSTIKKIVHLLSWDLRLYRIDPKLKKACCLLKTDRIQLVFYDLKWFNPSKLNNLTQDVDTKSLLIFQILDILDLKDDCLLYI